jgi:hypothetical protein
MSLLQTLRTLNELFDLIPIKPSAPPVAEVVTSAALPEDHSLSPEIQAIAKNLGLEFQMNGENIFLFIRGTPNNKYLDGPFAEVDLQVQDSKGAKNVRIVSFICKSNCTGETLTYRVFEIPQSDKSRLIKIHLMVKEDTLEELWCFTLDSIPERPQVNLSPPVALDHTVYEARPSDVFACFRRVQRST